SIDGLRLLRAAHREQLCAKRFAHRVVPDLRLLVDERVLQAYGLRQLRSGAFMIATGRREFTSDHRHRDLRNIPGAIPGPHGTGGWGEVAGVTASSGFCSLAACARFPFALYASARA